MKKFFIGVDVSKDTVDVSFFDDDRMKSPEYLAQYSNSPKGFREMVKDLRMCCHGVSSGQWLFCCETTGRYDHPLCHWLVDHGMVVWRESALQIKWSSGIQRGKNDRVDSLRIAEYAWRHQDKMQKFVKPSESLSNLKAAFTHRRRLVEKRTATRCQLKSMSSEKGLSASLARMIVRDLSREIERLSASIATMDESIQKIIRSDSELDKNYRHIISVKGVGPITAVALIVCSGNFKAITSAKKMACYCGVASFRSQSGTSINRKASVSNLSNRQIKSLLSMAARSASRSNPVFAEYFNRTLSRGKPVALVYNNLRNKIITVVYKLIERDCDFDVDYMRMHSTGQRANEPAIREAV